MIEHDDGAGIPRRVVIAGAIGGAGLTLIATTPAGAAARSPRTSGLDGVGLAIAASVTRHWPSADFSTLTTLEVPVDLDLTWAAALGSAVVIDAVVDGRLIEVGSRVVVQSDDGHKTTASWEVTREGSTTTASTRLNIPLDAAGPIRIGLPFSRTNAYPDENLTDALPVSVAVSSVAMPSMRFTLTAAPVAGEPIQAWGAELFPSFRHVDVTDHGTEARYRFPAAVQVSSVGPGPTPLGLLDVVVDARLVPTMTIVSAWVDRTLTSTPSSTISTSGGATTLSIDIPSLPAGSLFEVELESEVRTDRAVGSIRFATVSYVAGSDPQSTRHRPVRGRRPDPVGRTPLRRHRRGSHLMPIADAWVANSQIWINDAYTGTTGYNVVTEDGLTGWETVFGITRGLQIELGITALSDTFGPTTLSRLTSQVGYVSPSSPSDIVALMQCGMWCKGYSGGPDFGVYGSQLIASLPNLNQAMGLPSTSTLAPKAFKSLLTMDAYSLLGSGTSAAQQVQRWLNGTYLSRADYFIMPCDGLYSRDVQRGLMLAIQYELGMVDGVANGNFGPGTQSGLQTNGTFGLGAVDGARRLVRLFKAALIFNGYIVPFNGTFDSTTSSQTAAFQSFVGLPATGSANFATWASLLVSTGDPNRAVTASDTSTPLTAPKAASVYNAGYRTVGRYLSVLGKRYEPGELKVIFDAGLNTFPIYQEYNDNANLFTYALGATQGAAAVRRLRALGFKAGTVVYFAVDVDATNDEISAKIIHFFEGVRDAVNKSKTPYSVGVYGTRNVCSRISSAGLAVSSFVAGMSTGWSGNLGFPLPSNWAFDQIKNLPATGTGAIGSGPGAIEIDKDAKSATAPVVTSANVLRTPMNGVPGTPQYDETSFWQWTALGYLMDTNWDATMFTRDQINDVILNRLQKPTYWKMPGDDPLDSSNLAKVLFTDVYTPSTESTAGLNHLVLSYAVDAFEAVVGTGNYMVPASGRIGDIQHFAAVTRSFTNWGVPATGSGISNGDWGGWGLDLGTFWDDYEDARITAGGVLDVRTWTAANLGTLADNSFRRPDLQADAGGFLCAKRLKADPNRALEDIIREIFVGIDDDHGYLAKRFFIERFGTRTALTATAKSVFAAPFPINFLVPQFIQRRFPGATGSGNDPSPAVLATELDDFAEGFADAIEIAKTWTTV